MMLVSMGMSSNDIPLLDMIVNSFDNENSTIIITIHGKLILFSVKSFDVHRLIGLSYKDSKEPVNMMDSILNDQDKMHLEINYEIFTDYLTGERVLNLLSILSFY